MQCQLFLMTPNNQLLQAFLQSRGTVFADIDFWLKLLSVSQEEILHACYCAFQVPGLKLNIQLNKVTSSKLVI